MNLSSNESIKTYLKNIFERDYELLVRFDSENRLEVEIFDILSRIDLPKPTFQDDSEDSERNTQEIYERLPQEPSPSIFGVKTLSLIYSAIDLFVHFSIHPILPSFCLCSPIRKPSSKALKISPQDLVRGIEERRTILSDSEGGDIDLDGLEEKVEVVVELLSNPQISMLMSKRFVVDLIGFKTWRWITSHQNQDDYEEKNGIGEVLGAFSEFTSLSSLIHSLFILSSQIPAIKPSNEESEEIKECKEGLLNL